MLRLITYPRMQKLFASRLPESVIKRLSIRVRELGGVNLGQGIPSFPTASHIREAARLALEEKDIGVYPNFLGTIELREAIARKLSADHHIVLVGDKHILVTVGAMEATATAILSFVKDNDRVGIITPDYCNHFPQILLARGETIEIPLLESAVWQMDFKRIETEARRGLKLLILTNPSNPTGFVLSKKELKLLVALASKWGFWILADETYSFLVYEEEKSSLLDMWSQYDRLITVRSFSKEYAMTGWRVGYIVASEDIIHIFAKTHDVLTGCVPKISQRAAEVAISGPQAIVSEYKDVLTRRRQIVRKALDTMSDSLTYIMPQGAYYIFPKYKANLPSMELSEVLLRKARVAVVPGVVFGEAGEGHIRISFAVDDAVLMEGMKRLVRFFKDFHL